MNAFAPAFSAAMDAIFADQNMAVEAIWEGAGGGPLPVRVIRKAPDELTTFGAARILSDITIVDVRVSEMPTPKPGLRLSSAQTHSLFRASRNAIASG